MRDKDRISSAEGTPDGLARCKGAGSTDVAVLAELETEAPHIIVGKAPFTRMDGGRKGPPAWVVVVTSAYVVKSGEIPLDASAAGIARSQRYDVPLGRGICRASGATGAIGGPQSPS